jgi:hypothetical protein
MFGQPAPLGFELKDPSKLHYHEKDDHQFLTVAEGFSHFWAFYRSLMLLKLIK